MQVNVVKGGEQAFNALVYKPPEQGLLDYFQNNLNNATQMLGDAGQNFMNTAYNMYDKFNSSAVINAGKALLMNVGTHLNQQAIYYVDQNHMPNANLIMQSYIIANPVMNNLYQKNMAYGFQDTYFDPEPDNVGVERYDYQRVMDGVLTYDKEDNGIITRYFNSDEVELDSMEKITILDTWQQVEYMIANGIDPSDPDQGEL